MKKILVLSLILLGACAHMNSVSLTSIPAQRDQKVAAEATHMIFLGLNFDNDYVDHLVEDLKEQCASGKVQGILTKDENIDYFIGIVMKRKVTAQGYCVKG